LTFCIVYVKPTHTLYAPMLRTLIKRFIPARFWAATTVGRWVDYSRWNKHKLVTQGFERNPVFHAAVVKIARTISSMPIYIESNTRNGKLQTTEHPLLAALNRNEPIDQFIERAVSFYVVTGELYINKVIGDSVNKPLGYIVMPSQYCNPVLGDWNKPVRGFQYNENELLNFEADQVIFLTNISLSEYFHGISPGVPLSEVIDLHNAAITWNKNVALNGGTPPMYAIADGITEDDATVLKEKYRAINGGAQNAGDLKIVPGEMKLQTLAVRPNDAEWEKAVNMCARMILMTLGVPSELMNDAANKTYSNQREANKAFYTQTCIPIAEKIFAAISRDAAQYYKDDPIICIDKDQIEDLSEQRDRMATIAERLVRSRIIDENEAREMLGFARKSDEEIQAMTTNQNLRSVSNGI
jgi:HK97 family phage portal protein